MPMKLNDKNLDFYLALDFTVEELTRVFEVPPEDIVQRIQRLKRKQAKQQAAPPSPRAAVEPRPAVMPGSRRPMPPPALADEERLLDAFVAANDLRDWMYATFINEGGALCNPDHAHLSEANLGVIWTNVQNGRGGRIVVGQCERPAIQGGKWQKRRAELALEALLGGMPDFIITLDAVYAAQCDDITFCSLVEHELYHAGQAINRYGEPAVNPVTGAPIFALRAHDCEEFVGVVARYGVGAAAAGTSDLVDAALGEPSVGRASISAACGTCRR